MVTRKAADAVSTVTLIRGRNYSVVHPTDRRKGIFRFERGVSVVIHDPEVVEYLRKLTETVRDSDDIEIEKPMFRVIEGDHASESDEDDDEGTSRIRSRAVAGRRRAR